MKLITKVACDRCVKVKEYLKTNNDTYGQRMANRGYYTSVADIKSLWYSLNLTNKNKKQWDKELEKFSLYIQDLKN